MNPRFDFRVETLFHLRDGRTAFVGIANDGPGFITMGRFEVLVDDESRGIITIEGEMISEGPIGRPRSRSISTTEPFHLNRPDIEGRELVLRSLGQVKELEVIVHRHLLGLESPPKEFIPDPLSLGPILPEGWDGDAWARPNGRGYFLRAWNKELGRVVYGRGPTFDDARRELFEGLSEGGWSVEVTVRESSPA